MTAQRGKDILLKMDDDGDFVTIGGIRATRITFNADTVDTTTSESSGQWRELLAGAGVRTAAISGSGIFKDSATDALLREAFFDEEHPEFEIVIPDFGTVTGPFQITSLEYAGNHDGEASFEIALASAGELAFETL
ncbi:MAG: phage major tail protein, TP901-1 family [Pseudomonadota bacterium]